jgi:hypothetical protein
MTLRQCSHQRRLHCDDMLATKTTAPSESRLQILYSRAHHSSCHLPMTFIRIPLSPKASTKRLMCSAKKSRFPSTKESQNRKCPKAARWLWYDGWRSKFSVDVFLLAQKRASRSQRKKLKARRHGHMCSWIDRPEINMTTLYAWRYKDKWQPHGWIPQSLGQYILVFAKTLRAESILLASPEFQCGR